MLFNRIALEKHIYVATKAEKIRNSTHWILALNREGAQQPFHQRPDFAQSKRDTTSTWQGPKKTIEPFLAVNKKDSDMTMQSTLAQAGGSVESRGGPADSFVLVNKLGSKQLEDEQLEFQALFMV